MNKPLVAGGLQRRLRKRILCRLNAGLVVVVTDDAGLPLVEYRNRPRLGSPSFGHTSYRQEYASLFPRPSSPPTLAESRREGKQRGVAFVAGEAVDEPLAVEGAGHRLQNR